MLKRKRVLRRPDPELEALVKEKKEGYLKFINNRTDENRTDYKKKNSATVRKHIRTLNINHWDKYTAEIEHNVYGRQDRVFKFIRKLNFQEKDKARIEIIEEEVLKRYYKDLWYVDKN